MGSQIITDSGHYGESHGHAGRVAKENPTYYLDVSAPKGCGMVSCLECLRKICIHDSVSANSHGAK